MSGLGSAPFAPGRFEVDFAQAAGAPLDAVLFDLDGTLVATDRLWVPAAQRGARRAFRELGLDRSLPTPREWMRLVGMPLDLGLGMLLPELSPVELRVVQERCEEEERLLIRAGDLALLPGARETLISLREAGVRLGLASHCSRRYLEQVLETLGIGPLFEAARCLDSPCVRTAPGGEDFGGPKGRMVHDLLGTLGTRRAAFVGDRASDREAAHANGLPHFFFAGGFAEAGEGDGAEETLEDLSDLPSRLGGRWRWIAEQVGRLDLLGPHILALSGAAGTGKHVLARDLAAVLSVHLDREVPVCWCPADAGQPEGGGDGSQRQEWLLSALADRASDTPLILVGRDLGGVDPGPAAGDFRRLHLVAPMEVRRRRLLGALGPDASQAQRQAVHEELPRPARPLPGGPAETWDLTVPWAPQRA